MSAFALFQDFVVGALRSEFDVTHAEAFYFLDALERDVVGASAAAYAVDKSFVEIRLHGIQIIVLHLERKACEITSEKCHFNKTLLFLE